MWQTCLLLGLCVTVQFNAIHAEHKGGGLPTQQLVRAGPHALQRAAHPRTGMPWCMVAQTGCGFFAAPDRCHRGCARAQADDDQRCWRQLAAAAPAASAAPPDARALPPALAAALRAGDPGLRSSRLPQLARRLAGVLEAAGAGPPAFDPAALPGACTHQSALVLCDDHTFRGWIMLLPAVLRP